jgi:hypothetical protein
MALASIDLAIGPEGLTALLPGHQQPLIIPARIVAGNDEAGRLGEAFGRLEEVVKEALGISADGHPVFQVRVALLPPLSEARLVELPGLRSEEIAPVLRRDASRHFIGGSRDLVVGAARVAGSSGSSSSMVFAAAAPASFLSALRSTIEIRGWAMDRIVPAHAAWVAALRRLAPLRAGRSGSAAPAVRVLVAVVGETAHLIRLSGDGIDQIRKFPAADVAGIVDGAGSQPGNALVLGDDPSRSDAAGRSTIAAGLKSAGWVPVAPPAVHSSAAASAAHDVEAAVPEIVPDFVAAVRHQQGRRVTARLFTAANVILLTAAAVHYWGTARVLELLGSERAELSALVTPAMAQRDSLFRLEARLAELQALEAQARGWTSSLVELSVALPPETYLMSLRAAGDTVVLDAVGGRAGEALAALNSSRSLSDVRLEGTIQREIEGGTTARERFTLSGILTPAERTESDPAPSRVLTPAGP